MSYQPLNGTWEGTWKSKSYPSFLAFGTIQVKISNNSVNFTFTYNGLYKKGVSISHSGDFTYNVGNKELPIFSFKYHGQDFSFTTKERGKGKIAGEYNSNNPFDKGIFSLEQITEG